VTAPAPDSPLARLRASYQARQQADPDRFVDVWEDGDLVAKIARTEDEAAARGVMRMMGAIVNPTIGEELDISAEELADILAAVTVSLHYRNGDGLEPMLTDAGAPLRFGADFGEVIGVPEIQTPRGAVLTAFTSPVVEGGPPQLDTLRLMAVVTRVCGALVSGRTTAAAVVGKASAMVSAETRP
jgi:hypothetical protein